MIEISARICRLDTSACVIDRLSYQLSVTLPWLLLITQLSSAQPDNDDCYLLSRICPRRGWSIVELFTVWSLALLPAATTCNLPSIGHLRHVYICVYIFLYFIY